MLSPLVDKFAPFGGLSSTIVAQLVYSAGALVLPLQMAA